MSAEYIETKAKNGSLIRIEVEAGSKTKTGFGVQTDTAGAADDAVANIYEETLDTIRACASGMVDTLQSLETPPNAASVEFALKVDPKAGPMIARSGSNVHFKVSLSWKQPEAETEEENEA